MDDENGRAAVKVGQIGEGSYEICDECNHKARLGTEIGFYVFPGVTRALCMPFTGRKCLERRRAKYLEWRQREDQTRQA